MAGLVRALMVMPPAPERVKLEVRSWSCVGKRKTRVQVLPASVEGMSKLKRDEIVGEK